MTQVSGTWLTDGAAQTVFALLADGGFQAYAVGGCVRNALLNATVNDVDFATDAHPEQVVKLAKKAGLNAIPTGIEHGTVTVVSQGTGFEVTTFRLDVKTDGRRAMVAFAKTIEEDAHRRDFTMNALYSDHTGRVLDPLGGLADIADRHVRFIDDARARITEDYLRILRFFRFHAWFGDPASGIDADALAACAELAEGIDSLSKERIGAEMRKLLLAPDPAPSVASMAQSGVLWRVLPGADAQYLAVLVHHENQLGIAPDWLRRLACLGGQDHAVALKMRRIDQRQLALYQDKIGATTVLPELAYRHGAAAGIDISLLRATLLGTPLPSDLIACAEAAAAQVFPLKARDITTGEVGPALGARLKHLENEWIASQFTKTGDELLA